ncbi:MAG: sel1 repeat family protein [Rhodocyclaceae bacterium]|nr:sel1 repeat family protein [Rhodocyclaceae bacterium]
MPRMSKFPLLLASLLALSACVQTPVKDTVRICDDRGCADRPRDHASFDPRADEDPEAVRRQAALETLARKDPRAAYDLGLRFYRGDGVRQDSYQALRWMRDAAERGDLEAQKAVGRFYLTGLEEMGSDPQAAEKWLGIAASRGDEEAADLLEEAREAKRSDVAYRRWLGHWRGVFHGYWFTTYPYRAYWRHGYWYFY